MPPKLICPDGAGSLNNPVNGEILPSYTPTSPNMGKWEISTADDLCARNETLLQESWAAENLNINGAPIKVYKLLGVHEQGNGSLTSKGNIFATQSAPGFPPSNINNGSSWKSVQNGTAVQGNAWVGIDFGVKLAMPGGYPENSPARPAWQTVGAIKIQQADTATNYARQVRVDIADGSVEVGAVVNNGVGNGVMHVTLGPNSVQASISAIAISPTEFSITAKPTAGAFVNLGIATVGVQFQSVLGNILIEQGSIPFSASDFLSVAIDYTWKRVGVYNLTQSGQPIALNFTSKLYAKAIRIVPTLYTGAGNWEVLNIDVMDSPTTDINNIQDLFFQENRDRDYSKTPILIKAQYSMGDSLTDLSKFGFNILDQYSFTASFAVVVGLLGRPLVTGDIIEVVPELQYDHNLKPIRKFLEVTDTGWASVGYTTAWKPTLFRFQAQEATPSQETRDIFGTIDTQKYLVEDSIFSTGQQIDTSPLTTMEELVKEAAKAVPERGSDDGVSIAAVPVKKPVPPSNEKGQPAAVPSKYIPNNYIEDGLPKNGEPYGEGYQLPEINGAHDGDYFRLYYPDSTKIAPRLYRFSMVKNKWLFLEQDRRTEYASAKPSVHKILNSSTRQGLGKKTV